MATKVYVTETAGASPEPIHVLEVSCCDDAEWNENAPCKKHHEPMDLNSNHEREAQRDKRSQQKMRVI